MEIENTIDYNEVKTAVKMWMCKTDGYEGAIGGIMHTIPCDDEILTALPYDKMLQMIEDAVPVWNYDNIVMERILNGDEGMLDALDRIATNITNGILVAYSKALEMAEKNMNTKRVAVTMVASNGNFVLCMECFARTWKEAFDNVARNYLPEDKEQSFYEDFYDRCYEMVYGDCKKCPLYDGSVYKVEIS